jgi:hypothetical protein
MESKQQAAETLFHARLHMYAYANCGPGEMYGPSLKEAIKLLAQAEDAVRRQIEAA